MNKETFEDTPLASGQVWTNSSGEVAVIQKAPPKFSILPQAQGGAVHFMMVRKGTYVPVPLTLSSAYFRSQFPRLVSAQTKRENGYYWVMSSADQTKIVAEYDDSDDTFLYDYEWVPADQLIVISDKLEEPETPEEAEYIDPERARLQKRIDQLTLAGDELRKIVSLLYQSEPGNDREHLLNEMVRVVGNWEGLRRS